MFTRTLAIVSALSLGLSVSGHAFASGAPACDNPAGRCTSDSVDTGGRDVGSKDSVGSDRGNNDSRDATADASRDSGSKDSGSHDSGKDH